MQGAPRNAADGSPQPFFTSLLSPFLSPHLARVERRNRGMTTRFRATAFWVKLRPRGLGRLKNQHAPTLLLI